MSDLDVKGMNTQLPTHLKLSSNEKKAIDEFLAECHSFGGVTKHLLTMELIEREQQLKKLTDAWGQVKTGKGCIALVSGEAGIGKTSLIERFVAEQGKSVRVLWGACDDMFSPQPLGPFLDIALQIESDVLQLIQSGADRLTISTQFFIHLQKSPTPVIIVLEDLHWADEATLDVIKFLGRRIQLTKTLLILSYRDDELNSKQPLYLLLGDFPAHLSTRIPLSPLSRKAVQLMAEQAGRQPEDLYTVTAGNPFFVSEIIATEAEGVPSSVRDAVLARVARLSPMAKNIVDLASLVPGGAEVWLIQDILHPDPGVFDECVQRGILHSKGDALAFRHELARQSVEDSLPVGRTRDLHTRILGALLDRKTAAVTLARIVHHAARAGDEQATLEYAPIAARQASLLGAHREAVSLYTTIIPFAYRLAPEAQAELFEDLSFENYLTGRLEPAIQARHQAIIIWERLARRVRAGDCKRWLSRLSWVGGNKKEAERYADQAIESLMELPPGPELAMAFSNKSQLDMLAMEIEPALEWGQRAIKLAKKLNATEILVHALTNVGTVELFELRETGREKIETALQIATQQKMHDHVARCYANMVSTYVQTHQYSMAQQWLEDGLIYTTARDLDFYSVYLRGWMARMQFETGRWASAEENAREALRLSPLESVIPIPSLITLGHLKARRGDPDAQNILDQARTLAIPTGELQRIGPLAAAQAELAWWGGDRAQIAAEVAPGYELALRHPEPWVLGQLAYWMWRADAREVPLDKLAQPYAYMIRGEWRTAAQEWQRLGCPFEQALALADGDEQAQREALAIFEQLGARPAADILRKKLQAQGIKGVQPRVRIARQKFSASMTPRELEVLRLIGEGLSNPAIAQKLTVSVGTVKAHTASIYNKLGVNNRVQALAQARELSLL